MPITRANGVEMDQLQQDVTQMTEILKNAVEDSEARIMKHIDVRADALEDALKKYVDSVVLSYKATIAKQPQAVPSVSQCEQPERKLPPVNSDDVTETQTVTLVTNTTNSTDHLGTVPPGTVPPGTVPPGTVPPGTVLPGTVPPGTVPPGTVPPGTVHPDTNNPTTSAETEVKLKKTCRLMAAGPMKPLHTVYIGGLDYHTSEDALRAHLMDLNVDNIRDISKLVQHESDCAAFKVLISADSIRESVYGMEKFPTGVIVKPFRLYNPAVRSNSRNHTTQDSRAPTKASRFTANIRHHPRTNSINRQPLLNNPQPVNNAANNGRNPHFLTSNQHQQQIPDVNNSQQYIQYQHQTPDLYNTQQHSYNNQLQQYNTTPQIPTHLQYGAAAVQSATLTHHSAHHASAPLRGNDVPTYMDNTRSLPYPVGDQCNTTTSAHLPYQQQNINNDRLPYPLNHSTVNLQY